ncbi:MAG: hypothetical protein LBJ00_05150 [Planctomycetaceae bacterium]|nr:hypothetical protein [Planctomycetaceae bacterium]
MSLFTKILFAEKNYFEFSRFYTVAGKAIGFALEQPLRVVALACSASGILKQFEYKSIKIDRIRIKLIFRTFLTVYFFQFLLFRG